MWSLMQRHGLTTEPGMCAILPLASISRSNFISGYGYHHDLATFTQTMQQVSDKIVQQLNWTLADNLWSFEVLIGFSKLLVCFRCIK